MRKIIFSLLMLGSFTQPALAKTHFNSKQKMLTSLPNNRNLLLADMDGDGLKDFVAYTQDDMGFKISVGSSNWYPTLRASYDSHFDEPARWIMPGYPSPSFTYIDRVFAGRFASTTKEWFCFRARSRYQGSADWNIKNIYCFEEVGGILQVVSEWAAPAVWLPQDQHVVGDFDGDGLDELLTYDRDTGSNVWVIKPNQLFPLGFEPAFNPLIGYDPGDFAGFSWPGGVTFHAGNFENHASEGVRDDILIENDTTRELRVFHARQPAGGSTTFGGGWGSGPIASGPEELNVADADGDGFEDLIVHDALYGNNRFLSLRDTSPTAPLPWGQPESGQLPWFGAPTENHLFFGLAKKFPGEGGDTNTRDDVFAYIVPWDAYARSDARYCDPSDPQCGAGKKTYWWYYTLPMSALRSALSMSYYDGP